MKSTASGNSTNVYRKSGTQYSKLTVLQKLGDGGEGEIYEVASHRSQVVKLYRTPTENKCLKLEAMLKATPDDPQRIKNNHVSICWPEEIVFLKDKSLAGFLMPRLDTGTHKKVSLCWDAHDRAQSLPGFTWKYICAAAENIASVVDLIHHKGHAIGDINDENFLVNGNALVALIDCDSMQVRDSESGDIFKCEVARPEYLAPEALSKNLTIIDRTAQQDNWSLAVLVFKMLMEGHHPSNGVGPINEIEKRVKAGIFPFYGAAGWQLPSFAPPVNMLPDELNRLFKRCFQDGLKRPEVRPTASEWRKALKHIRESLRQCVNIEAHWHSPHLSQCPWCQLQDETGHDHFDISIGEQVALPTPVSVTSLSTVHPTTAVSLGVPPTQPPVSSPKEPFEIVKAWLVIIALLALPWLYIYYPSGSNVHKPEAVSEAQERTPSDAVTKVTPHREAPLDQPHKPKSVPEVQERPPVDVVTKVVPHREALLDEPHNPKPIPEPQVRLPSGVVTKSTPRRETPLAESTVSSQASTSSKHHATPDFTFFYSSPWTVEGDPQDPSYARFYVPSNTKILADGYIWAEYVFSIRILSYQSSPGDLEVWTNKVLAEMAEAEPSWQQYYQIKEKFLPPWGRAIVTGFYSTSDNGQEFRSVSIAEWRKGIAIFEMVTPLDKFDLTDSSARSISFRSMLGKPPLDDNDRKVRNTFAAFRMSLRLSKEENEEMNMTSARNLR